MLTKAQILSQIQTDWVDNLAVRDICVKILLYLVGKEQQHTEHITYENLRTITNFNYEETQLLLATKYLCNSKILELKFEFIDIDSYEISLLDIKEAEKEGFLSHPCNGVQKIYNYHEYIFYYFRPTELARTI